MVEPLRKCEKSKKMTLITARKASPWHYLESSSEESRYKKMYDKDY